MSCTEEKGGQAFLALIFFIGGIVLLIGVTIAFLANSFIDTGYGYKASLQAEAAAASGANDALLQLERNPNFYYASPGYGVAVGSSTAAVTVTQNSPSSGFITILSTATVSNRTRNVNVVLSLNATTSQMSVVSWQLK